MIHIIDNGGQYSDHSIYFVESDLTPEQVDKLLERLRAETAELGHNVRSDLGLCNGSWCELEDGMERIASAPAFSWREADIPASATLDELFEVTAFEDRDGEFIWGKDAEAGRELYRRVMAEVRG